MARLTDRARNDLKCVEGPLNRNQTKPNKYRIYAWIGDVISRENSVISVSAVLHFTWCGMVRCGAYI